MPVVALLHRSRSLGSALRRGLRDKKLRLKACRSREHLDRVLGGEVVDAVVLELDRYGLDGLLEFRRLYPRIPVFLSFPFRPVDGALLSACGERGFRDFLVEGVDEAAAAELVAARGLTAQRAAALADAPRLLRLTEPLQLRAWAEVLWRPDARLTTGALARTFSVSREYLSREFGAGGAPNLKRVIDLAKVLCAADLLANPGYTVAAVSEVLGYSSASHFAACVRRICGIAPPELPRLGPQGVLARFLKGRTRSRGWRG
ncbi:hypothetical protein HRbin33_00427 [bacterium HR33]|nr:hypothetical protein HRbin33_00427 [bacterium HR33]